MDPFAGRVAVVTGGGSGIGAALARAFAARGAHLVLADLDPEAMAAVAADLAARGTEVLCVPTDVGEREQVEALAAATVAHFGAVHLVCNNAGICVPGDLATATHADWVYTLRVNLWGVVHGIEVFVPRLLAQGAGGHVINTASMAGLVGMQGLGVYSASKFAVVGLSEALYRELTPKGVGVTVVCPMVVRTNIDVNSVRQRPAALRAPGASVAAPSGLATLAGSVIEPDQVAWRVVRAIERGDLYVLTHPEQREILRRRAERLERMFDPERW
jgi:NAD(P)-dependent dehydrogenase (short-subunit alcohol dehydrogenase family)